MALSCAGIRFLVIWAILAELLADLVYELAGAARHAGRGSHAAMVANSAVRALGPFFIGVLASLAVGAEGRRSLGGYLALVALSAD